MTPEAPKADAARPPSVERSGSHADAVVRRSGGLAERLLRPIPRPWRPLALITPLGLALLLRGLSSDSAAPPRRPPPLVETAAVQIGDLEVRQPISGEVRPLLSVEVRPEVSGTIQQVLFQEGTAVRRGQPLALINASPYQVALDQARANTARALARLGEARAQRQLAAAELRLASDRAHRYVGLSRQGALSRDDEENYRTQEQVARARLAALQGSVASAEAEVAAARAAEAAARLDLDRTIVRAPITGRIGQTRISQGNLVREQETRPLVVINQITPLDLAFAVPQPSQAAIRVGQSLRFEGHRGLRGRVVSLDNTTNAGTGTVMAKARLDGPTQGLTPGDNLSGSLLVSTLRGALLLPNRAVQMGQQGPFVYVARGGRAALVPVRVLAADGGRTAVEAALKPGEAVVVAGQFALVPGAPLRRSAAAGGAAAGGPGR